jgi:hypothetical protein
MASSPGEPRNKSIALSILNSQRSPERKTSGLRAFATAKTYGMTAMKALRLRWKWLARLARHENEARHALRAWLLI